MLHIVTRKEEEIETLEKFINNQNEKFDYDLVKSFSENNPIDFSYKGINYQITYGDQLQLAERRKITSIPEDDSRSKQFIGIRNLSGDWIHTFLYNALNKKRHLSGNNITLLIDCFGRGDNSSLPEREEKLKKFFSENQYLGGSWQHIYIVFSDGNIKLH